MNKLAEYFEKSPESINGFAQRIGRNSSVLYRVMSGESVCTPALALDIERGTSGKVKAKDVFDIRIQKLKAEAAPDGQE